MKISAPTGSVLAGNQHNINIIKKNARAIDLGDTINKIAIQVTSTNDIAKIKHTHKGFVADNLQTVYDRLIILIIGEKKDYRESSIGNGTIFELSVDDDVWGLAELLTKIGNLGISKLEVCLIPTPVC
ncbi:SMEK domain-containing protein [Gluconacetobacter diazotrophicus]|uniref:SMEK domain-containing protein n=1 Tax=Gluconacetobacter diazotrophicus TaxID=33996 RepID=UPI0012FF4247|nr:SMEK domain-containing protein [Gluconacetobacter diazotrophicus]